MGRGLRGAGSLLAYLLLGCSPSAYLYPRETPREQVPRKPLGMDGPTGGSPTPERVTWDSEEANVHGDHWVERW